VTNLQGGMKGEGLLKKKKKKKKKKN